MSMSVIASHYSVRCVLGTDWPSYTYIAIFLLQPSFVSLRKDSIPPSIGNGLGCRKTPTQPKSMCH